MSRFISNCPAGSCGGPGEGFGGPGGGSFSVGISTGLKCANQIANTFLHQLDRFVVRKFRLELKLYRRLVDDILIVYNSTVFRDEFKVQLCCSYKMRDLGQVCQFLGVDVVIDRGKIFIHQSVFTHNLLEKFGLLDCK